MAITRKSVLILAASAFILLSTLPSFGDTSSTAESAQATENDGSSMATAIFAGGCFWCIEADFEKLSGVKDVVSGYIGGSAETADYKTVSRSETGHYEAVRVTYDSTEVSYSELLEYFWRHIDPTDPDGQFCDKGSSYKSAVFYKDSVQKQIIDDSITRLNDSKPFAADIVTDIVEETPFYLAEKYHQDYYKKNPIRYRYYRRGCGRDKRIKQLWGTS